jgi:class 3 adenylate cyclase
MGLKDDLVSEVATIFRSAWEERDGEKVPEAEDLKLGNDAVKLTGTVLYADLADSTALVDGYKKPFVAEIYKTFLHCAAKIIRSEDGAITAYDGDRIMAVYIGNNKNTSAVRSAMKINYAVTEIIRPALKKQYPNDTYVTKHVIGIDTSDLFVARTGVRGANDLVWVGRAANYAAKLSALPESYATYITSDVYDVMHKSVKFSKEDGTGDHMWTKLIWNEFNNSTIYGSTWWWTVS